MVGIAMALILVGNPAQIGGTSTLEPQQEVICSEAVQIVGSEVNEVNEPIREIPQEGYITINDVVDAWDVTVDYAEQEKYVLVDTQEEKLEENTDAENEVN